MSYLKVWVHLVFTTKYRTPFLEKNIRDDVFQHIKKNCEEKAIYLDAIGGYSEHVHCLIALGKEQTIANIMQLIKGESSFWINKNKLTVKRFSWQDDYYAVSVSPYKVITVRNYIRRQEEHHNKQNFMNELRAFVKKEGFEQLPD